MAAWKLPEQQLKQLALNATRIRQRINEKAEGQRQDQEIPLGDAHNLADGQAQEQVQILIRHSTRASNPEGLLEKELKARE